MYSGSEAMSDRQYPISVDAKSKRMKDERVLHIVNKFITLKDADTKRNNEILRSVIEDIIDVLKNKDAFFRDFYSKIEFVGSYYKGTKVGKPEEFDLNVIIRMPVNYEFIEIENGHRGFRKIKLNPGYYSSKWDQHRKVFSKWVQNDYLNQDKFRQWFESLFANMPREIRDGRYKLGLSKSGPAFTLKVIGQDLGASTMCVDLVPVLEFKNILTDLQSTYGQGYESWFAVPKPFKSEEESLSPLNWRPSFYMYEKNILKRNGQFKPIIRYIKKLRDNENWKLIASYHIETLCLREIVNNPMLQKSCTIDIFIHMLECLRRACEDVVIFNFWESHHNLLSALNIYQLQSIAGRLKRIIEDIKADRMNMAKYLLTDLEQKEIEKDLNDIRSGRNTGNKKKNPQPTEQSEEVPQSIISGIWNLFSNISTNSFSSSSSSSSTNVSSIKVVECNENLRDVLKMLQLIRNEVADTKDAINNLTNRVNEEFHQIRTFAIPESYNNLTSHINKQFMLVHKEIEDAKYQLGMHVIDVNNGVTNLQKHLKAPTVVYHDSHPTYFEWEH